MSYTTSTAPSRRWQFGLPLLFAGVTCVAVAMGVARFYGSNAVETTVVVAGTVLYVVLLVMPGVAFASLGVRYGRPVTFAAVGGGMVAASYARMIQVRFGEHPLFVDAAVAGLGAVVGLLCGAGVRQRARFDARAVGWGVVRDRCWQRGTKLSPVLLLVWLACLHLLTCSALPRTFPYRHFIDGTSLSVYGWSLAALPALTGCGALWAALARRYFAIRLAVVGGATAFALPLQPGDLAVVFGVQSLVVASAVRVVVRARESGGVAALRAFLWTDALPLAIAAGLLAALAFRLTRMDAGLAAGAAIVGVFCAVVTLAAAWAAFSGRVRPWRVAIVALAVAWAGDWMVALCDGRAELRYGVSERIGWWWFVVAAGMALVVFAWLHVWRLASRASPRPAGERGWALMRLHWAARIAAGAAAVGILVVLAIQPLVLYRQLRNWPTSAAASIPNPNGIDELVQAQRAIPRPIMVTSQSLDERRAWVAGHAAELATARRGLGRECRALTDEQRGLLHVDRLFAFAGDVAVDDGRPVEAFDFYYDALRTVRVAACGGGQDWITREGHYAAGIVHKMCVIREQLQGEDLHRALAKLQDYESAARPFADAAYAAKAAAGTWRERLAQLLEEKRFPWRITTTSGLYSYGPAALRLLIGNLALEAYRERHGQYPATLAELTPDFLPSVPIDPYGPTVGVPLVYRKTADGFLLYSIGPDWLDDGGKRSRAFGSTGDFDLPYFEFLPDD